MRLTELSHGGGCGCKIAPSILRDLLARAREKSAATFPLPSALLVGNIDSDDAAVYQLNKETAIAATADFFTPIVDDPRDFGRIAAANALSDIYAMGARPLFALAILAMPLAQLSSKIIGDIIAGGESICHSAGIPIAGGHSIDSIEPIYGLIAIGRAHPNHITTNASGKIGDAIILGKPLGVGILSAALKKNQLNKTDYEEMIRQTTQLNSVGAILAEGRKIHAMTDVTGFGLLGHLLEVCRASNCDAAIEFEKIPLMASAAAFAREGVVTGASSRNWKSYSDSVYFNSDAESWKQNMLADPQTSGGLLITCGSADVDSVISIFRESHFAHASVIGELRERKAGGESIITVT